MERGNERPAAKPPRTPLERAQANPAVREGLLRSIAAKLRGEKPSRATELIERLEIRRNDAER